MGNQIIAKHRFGLHRFWYAITVRLPERCEFVLREEVDKWYKEQAKYLESKNDNTYRFNKSQIKGKITDSFRDFVEELKKNRHDILVKEVNQIGNYYE